MRNPETPPYHRFTDALVEYQVERRSTKLKSSITPAIVKAILETGYTGYFGKEFIPKRDDKLASLKQGVTICSV